jgi:hypothetical protein
MGFSIYYAAKRDTPLTHTEVAHIGMIVNSFDVADQIERYAQSGKGFNWESFTLYPTSRLTGEDVLSGATALPDNKAFAMHKGARHWVDCLNQIRREVLPDARWSAQIEDKPLLWDDKHGWHDEASDGLASLWLGCLLSAPFRLFTRRA